MKKKKFIAMVLFWTLSCTIIGCGKEKDETDEISLNNIIATTQEVSEQQLTEELMTDMSYTSEESSSFDEAEYAYLNGTLYETQGVRIKHSYETSATDNNLASEIVEVKSVNSDAIWTYRSEEAPIGQYDTVSYVVNGSALFIVDAGTLHVYKFTNEDVFVSETNTVKLNSFYNGGSCIEDGFIYMQNADGGEVIKLDLDGNTIWEINNEDADHANSAVGGGGILELEGDILHCYYDFADYERVDISKEDGSFIGTTEAQN